MKAFSFHSLRVKLIFLVLMAVLPALALIVTAGVREHAHLRNQALQDALNLAKNISAAQDDAIKNARNVLFFAVQMMEEHEHSPETFRTMFERLSPLAPELTGLIIARPDGEVMASTYDAPVKLNFADRSFYSRLMETKDFVIGGYQKSGITGKSVLTLAYPVLDRQGRMKGIIGTGLDFSRLNRFIDKSGLPEGVHLNMVDENGALLFRYPGPADFAGPSAHKAAIIGEVLKKKEGFAELPDAQGLMRLYGFTSLGGDAGALYVIVGIPKEVAFARLNRITVNHLIWFLVASGVVLILAWYGGDAFVVRSLERLLGVARQIEKGVLTARVGPSSGHGEIAELSRAVDNMASALERRETESRESAQALKLSLRRLTALRDIDMAITASLDLRVTLNVILDQVKEQLQVDAAVVLLMDRHSLVLEYAAGRGFVTSALRYTKLRLGEGTAGLAALERRTIMVNLDEGQGSMEKSPLMEREGFQVHIAVPLISKGHVQGVLEIFHRQALNSNQEWRDFLDALAGQAAIAVDNASLFNDLERSNIDLTMAYDTTLEGWSRALDLRDRETEGHSRRVTEMTVRLARALGIDQEEIAHIRRGALLHDIGKMGVPDSILLKPGPLTDEEWEIMRRHPLYAYEFLQPIKYLRPALEVPYCHHEKWDGTGYPRGLKGEAIPLGARIFAVVDVWDALRSERPYRLAWPEEKALSFIREQSGRHFDPKVVEVFLNTVCSAGS